MKLPWVRRSTLELVKAAGEVAVALSEAKGVGMKKLQADIDALQKELGEAKAEIAIWKKQFDDVDARNKAMIEADPVKVYAQDGPDEQASLTVVCRVDRRRLLRRPDKVFDAFGRRVGAELNTKFKALLDELRLADNKAQAAATYREP